jgi:hypothetical protein
MHIMQFKRNLFVLLILTGAGLSACGVKGPPEPPYPTEATVKKEEPSGGADSVEKKSDVPFSDKAIDIPPAPKSKKKKSK